MVGILSLLASHMLVRLLASCYIIHTVAGVVLYAQKIAHYANYNDLLP